MKTQADRWSLIVLFTLLAFTLAVPGMTQDKVTTTPSQEPTSNVKSLQFSPGREAVVQGVIVKRGADSFTMHDLSGSLVEVSLTANTEVKERKSNPFRRAKNYGVTQLLRGLDIEVKGHGGNSGALVADTIRFTQDDFRLASTMDARVVPVENRVSASEVRLGQSEENAMRLSGQVSELSAVSNAARGGAKAAQETADSALESAKQANLEANNAKVGVTAANQRISAIDDFDTKETLTVNFKLGSAQLSNEAKADLDKIAQAALSEKGYVIEVAGFASADGSDALNRVLSQHRADAVIRYLAENYAIPLRRFITPFGYGDKMPVADNNTRTGRIQNRRVEVKILISKGLVQTASSSVAMN